MALLGVCALSLAIGTPAVGTTITTATGVGADAFVASYSGNSNFQESGTATYLFNKRTYTYDRMSILKFDLSTMSNYADTASLDLMIGYGGKYPVDVGVYGVNDSEYADGWGETTVTWNNAPGNDTALNAGVVASQTTLLNTYSHTGADTQGQIHTLASGPALVDFLNADTDGLVTILLPVTSTVTNFNVGYMGKSNTDYLYNSGAAVTHAPTLEITEVLEPIFAQPAGFRYLAADPSLRAGLSNATVRMRQATHVGEVLKMEEDWEAGLDLHAFVSGVVTDPATGKLRMYYGVKRISDKWKFIAMAESDDGINWTKPELNITGTLYVNDPRNNFIDQQQATGTLAATSVFVDPNGPDEERYKMARQVVSAPPTRELVLSNSADGLHFSDVGVADQQDQGLDSLNITFWDPKTQQYHAYMRWNYNPSGRGVTHKRSDTWEGTWSGGREYTIDPVHDSLPQIYSNGVRPYHGQYIGLPAMFYGTTNGSIYPTFMYSRDGSEWHFEDPEHPVIDLGAHGATVDTAGMAFPAPQLVERDGKLWIYYMYTDNKRLNDPEDGYTLNLATIRQDGFVAIESEPGQLGTWTTSTIKLPQEPVGLLINAVVRGSLYVEVLDPTTMDPLLGFTSAEAMLIGQGDYLDVAASWQGADSLATLAGQEVVFRFAMDDASIYSFSFAAVPEPGVVVLLFCGMASLGMLKCIRIVIKR